MSYAAEAPCIIKVCDLKKREISDPEDFEEKVCIFQTLRPRENGPSEAPHVLFKVQEFDVGG